MAALVTGDCFLAVGSSDPHPNETDLKTPNSAEDNNLTLAQLAKTSHSQPHIAMRKRRKSKPTRFEIPGTDVKTKHPPPTIDIVLSDPSSPCLSNLPKEKSPNKGFKTPLPKSPAMIRALKVQSSLGSKFPTCIKTMVPSQVNCGFWMGLPLHFCKSYLPKEDATFALEDENGEQCEVKYIAYKYGLSAGWKKFAIRHNLIEGDCLVFHLVETTKFKVYIIRDNDSKKGDGALGLLKLDAHAHAHAHAHAEQTTPDDVKTVTPSPKAKNKKRSESLSLTAVQKKHKNSSTSSRSVTDCQFTEHSGNDSEEVGSEVLELEGSRFSKPLLSFEEVKSFEDFHIVVKGLCIDHELPDDVRMGYYKLCFYEKKFLHEGVPESLYYKLVAGMIGELVTVAKEIKQCQLTTSKEEFETWDNSLKSFELLGMKVGFLRDKIHALATLVFESEGASDLKRYGEAINEQTRLEDEIMEVSARLKELKENAKRLGGVSSHLKEKIEKYEHKFKEEVAAHAPW